MKKSIIILVIILFAAGLGAYAYVHNKAQAPTNGNSGYNPNDQPVESPDVTPSPTPSSAKPTPSPKPTDVGSGQGGEVSAPNIQVTEIDFDGAKFTPDSVIIKINDYVFFKNTGTGEFWPLTTSIQDYPEFDSFKNITPGKEFKFQFTKPGKWRFTDKLKTNIVGTVNVVNQ